MSPLAIHAILPAENPAHFGQSLNVLLVVENPTQEALVRRIRFWGSNGGPWRELLLSQPKSFPPESHVHLYFNLPADRFSSDFWGGEAPEELSIAVCENAPTSPNAGILVFFE